MFAVGRLTPLWEALWSGDAAAWVIVLTVSTVCISVEVLLSRWRRKPVQISITPLPPEGCAFCRDPASVLTDGLAASAPAYYLLRCPECWQYYLGDGCARQYPLPLSFEEVALIFPEAIGPVYCS